MKVNYPIRHGLMALVLVCVLAFGTACGSVTNQSPQANYPESSPNVTYGQLARGNSGPGQAFGDWVVKASKGLIRSC